MLSKVSKYFSGHKTISIVAIFLVIGIGYFGVQKLITNDEEVEYVTKLAQRGLIISSVTGSGQVSTLNQVDIKSKISGEVVYVGAKQGQEVGSQSLLVQLDAGDASKAVRDAEVGLESAKLDLEKLIKPASELAILQAKNDLVQAQESKLKAEDALEKAYENGFNGVSDVFLSLPSIMTGLQDILYSNDLSPSQGNLSFYVDKTKSYDEKIFQYKTDVEDKYRVAREEYDVNFENYKSTGRYSDVSVVENLIDQTYDTVKTVAEAIKSANNLIQFYKDEVVNRNLTPNPLANTHLLNLDTYTGDTNTYLLSLLTDIRSIQDNKEDILNANRDIDEKTAIFKDLKDGADELDIRSRELSIKQKENTILDAQEKLSDYYIYSHFVGIVADINVQKGETIGSNTVVANIITKQKIAEITLNEVEMVNIKIGQKTIITFDAIDGLSISGEVISIDTVGTITQGVVNYGVEITFDTQDERIKPSMSVSAMIITESKQDVLIVPNSAIKSRGDGEYIDILVDGDVRSEKIITGIGNDIMTEIVEGIKEGESVIVRSSVVNSSQQILPVNGGVSGRSDSSTRDAMRMMR